MKGILIEDLLLQERIAHEGYPWFEALYGSIKEYETFTGRKLIEEFCDSCGYVNGTCGTKWCEDKECDI